jgi:hypothetical protein
MDWSGKALNERPHSRGEYAECKNSGLVGYPEGGFIKKYLCGNVAMSGISTCETDWMS